MSIHHKAVLVCLSLTGLGNSRKDKSTTDEVLYRKSASEGAGRWSNSIWPKAALDPIMSLDGKIRKYLIEKSLPWIDDGRRLLPTNLLQEVSDRIRQFKAEREALVSEFFRDYHQHVATMRQIRGQLFRDDDYSPPSRLRDRFGFQFDFSPVPHQNDFRIKLSDDQRAEMEESVRAALGAAEAKARRDLTERILEPLRHMADVLSKSEPGKIYDSLLANVLTIAKAIPDYNVTDDPRLAEIQHTIEARFSFTSTESLRSNPMARARTAKAAADIADGLAAFMGMPASSDPTADLAAVSA